MRKFIQSLARDERGVTALEYAILAGVVVAALVGIGTTFGDEMKGVFGRLGSELKEVAPAK